MIVGVAPGYTGNEASTFPGMNPSLAATVLAGAFIGDQLVAPRHGYIDSAPARVSLVMGMIGLLDGHIAAVDVVAKFFQSRCIFQNEIVDLVRFFQTPVRDFNRQLHG